MRNASGYHRDEDRWPLPVVVVPRGAREWLWHCSVLLAAIAPFVTPGGWAVFITVVGITWLMDSSPAELLRVAMLFVATGFLVAALFASPDAFLLVAGHALLSSRAPDVDLALTIALGYCFEATIALCSVAVFVGFDRRVVRRSAVDLRVWQRQQTRRRQLLRRWHARAELPEVSG